MNRIIGVLLFFTFFIIYFGMHIYSILRVSGLFGFERNRMLYLMIFLSAALFPAAGILIHYFGSIIVRGLYTIASIWTGLVWLLFGTLIVYEISRLVIKFQPRTYAFIIISIVMVLGVVSVVNGFLISVKSLEIPIEGLTKEVNIVQLTDIHVGTVHNSGYLNKIIQKTNKLSPDIVFITGDLIDGSGFYRHETYRELKQIDAPCYFVTGNHEFYAGEDKVTRILNSSVTVLRNQVQSEHGLQIIGIDDPGNSGHINMLKSRQRQRM